MTPAATSAELLPPPIGRRPAHDAGAPGPLWTEWSLTNGLGGYAMGTVLGTPTRRYHGLLVAAARPPVERYVALCAVHETIVLGVDAGGGRRIHLTPFHFEDAGERAIWSPHLAAFERGLGWCRWVYRVDAGGGRTLGVRKHVHLFRDRQAVSVRYELAGAACRIELRPLVAMRGFHSLPARGAFGGRFEVRQRDEGILVGSRDQELELTNVGGTMTACDERWRGFAYAWEERRGLESSEDLLAPAVVHGSCDGAVAAHVELFAEADGGPPLSVEQDAAARTQRAQRLIGRTLGLAGIEPGDPEAARPVARLALAGDEFIVERAGGVSVIAGYPWFADWGRDSMISLPGLLLVTGRLGEAMDVLRTFARARRNGLIPNRFDDHDAPAHYNTVDAPLWFVHAAREYLDAGGDAEAYHAELVPACVEIVEAFLAGTDLGIGVDDDGLVFAGDASTQLTWMDAQRDGVTFTPRHGKACEINALWFNALRSLAPTIWETDPERAARYEAHADRAGAAFRAAFVRPDAGLIDHFTPHEGGWAARGGVRPNQVFAASLPHSPLDDAAKRRVVDEVRRELLTPYGLRTLSRAGASGGDGESDAPYRGRYEGSLFERDAAYHNGTAWPWLLGPYAEAVMRVGAFSPESRGEARRVLSPLVRWAEDGWSPGQLPEIFDGDGDVRMPQRPDGCPAQAWSVAESLRVWVMALDSGPGSGPGSG